MSIYGVMKIGKKISALRKSRAMSQTDLAGTIHVTQSLVSLWERDMGVPSLGDALMLARIFGVSLDFLADDDADEPPAPPMTADEAVVLKVYRNSGLTSDEAIRRFMARGGSDPPRLIAVREADPHARENAPSGRAKTPDRTGQKKKP